MTTWPVEVIAAIAASDDLHIAPYRPSTRVAGTPTWIWSVVVDGRLFVRAWNGVNGRWYASAITEQAGQITAAGHEYVVRFAAVSDEGLNDRIDAAYRTKYAGSSYLAPMVAAGPRAATVEITPAGSDAH